MANQPDLIPSVWAANNTSTETIPATTTVVGKASWDQGFPIETGKPLSQGGVPPRYGDFNGVLNALSQFAVFAQSGGQYAWTNSIDYSVGSIVLGTDSNLYRATQVSGPTTAAVNPVGDTSGKWAKIVSQSDLDALLTDVSTAMSTASDAASNASAAQSAVTTLDANVVKLSGNQTVAGTKTFSSATNFTGGVNIEATVPTITFKDTGYVKGDAVSASQYDYINFGGSDASSLNTKRLGAVGHVLNPADSRVNLVALKNATGASDYTTMSLVYPNSGDPYAIAPTTPKTASSNEIVTADFYADKDLTNHIQDTYGNPVLWNFGGIDCGGDLPNLDGFDDDQWNGATQSVFVDRFAGVYYLSQQNSSYATRLVAVKWSDDPAQRVRLGQTSYSYGLVGHQNNTFYRPTSADEPLFFCPANYYDSSSTWSIKYIVRVLRWSYTTSTPTLVYALKIFDSAVYTTDNLLEVCVSADSKWLVAEAKRNSDNIRVCRVWDAAEVLAYAATATPDGNGQIDISSLVKREFDVPTLSVGQGIFCDGFYVYHLTGANINEIRAYALGGPENNALNLSFTMNRFTVPEWEAGIGTTWTYILYEPEGIFWAEYGGKVQAFLHVSAALHYDRDGADAWKRKDRFFALSIPQQTHVFSKDYLLCFGQGEKPPTEATSTYEHTRFYHVRERQQDPTLSTYSYIASNRSTGTIGTDTMTGGLFFGFSEKKKAMSFYKMMYSTLLDEETGTLTHGTNTRFSYSASNVATLGNASELWKEAFIGNATINTSDERKKDNVTAFPDAVLDAWGEVGWCQYQMKDALAEKGEAARLHSGVIAQRIASIFEAHGLDASRYGLFCYDKWDDEYDEQEDGKRKLVRKAGDGYGIRYAEALAMEAAYQRRRADRAGARITALEQRFDELEEVLASLIAPVGDETYAEPEQQHDAEQESEE